MLNLSLMLGLELKIYRAFKISTMTSIKAIESIGLAYSKYVLLLSLVFIYHLAAGQHSNPIPHNEITTEAQLALDKIKNLQGKWKGTFQWSGHINASGKNIVEYHLTGHGSAVLENIIAEDGTISMSSVYHLDGESLRMTHYCAANNQPRLIASDIGKKQKEITFEMVDISNLKHEKAGHVYGVKLEFIDKNNLNIIFKYISNDKKSVEVIKLERVDSSFEKN